MANKKYKLADNYWETSGVFDIPQNKTQRQINEEVRDDLSAIQQHKRKVLFVGDSYGAQANSWVTFAAQHMGLDSTQYTNASVSGIGFIVDRNGNIGENYNGFLDAITSVTADRDSYTDVVICGGINDAQYDRVQTFFPSHIKNTINYVRQNFKNAKIRIGYISGALNDSSVLFGRTLERQEIAKYVYIAVGSPYYLNGVENAIHQSLYCYGNDRLHPNATGSEIIGQSVATALETGFATCIRPEENVTLIPSAGRITNQLNRLYYKNDSAILIIDNSFTAEAGDVTCDISNGLTYTFNEFYVNKKVVIGAQTYVRLTDGNGVVIPIRAELYQNTLTIFPIVLSNNRWASISINIIGISQPLVFQMKSSWIN